jgi:hypothetical protein
MRTAGRRSIGALGLTVGFCALGGSLRAAVPAAPSNLVAAAASQTQITLTWTDHATNETAFRIERAAAATGTWALIATASSNVTTYANTGLVANALWYYRVCASNSSGASAYTAVANAHTAYASEYGGVAVWRALLLVYTNTDADYVQGGTNKHYTGSMNAANRDEGVWAFHQYGSLANELSDRECIAPGDVVYPVNAITSVTDRGGNNYWVTPNDIAADLDTYAPPGNYDSIMVYWNPGDIPSSALGLAYQSPVASAHGATYALIREWGGWDGEGKVGEAWLHEWIHGITGHYTDYGHRMPNNNADGKGEHGYTNLNWEYYYDLLRDRVWETNPPPSDYTGVPVQGWRQGGPLNHRAQAQGDWFYMDSRSRYEKTGTVNWDSTNFNVSLGAAGNADHEMWAPVIVSNSITLRAGIYVPASPGVSNYSSVAVKDGTTNEWRAALEYGTNLPKRLALRYNGAVQSTNAMSLTTGWYTVEMELDYAADTIRAKAWKRDVNEPATWQTTGVLAAAYAAGKFGFHHLGNAANADDLVLTADTGIPPPFQETAAATLPGVSRGPAEWGDYDNDGDLDLLLAGQGNSNDVAAVYRNDGGGAFSNIAASLPAVREAAGAWGDYDNDGDLDFVLAGWSTGLAARLTRIYRNDGGAFTQAVSLTGVNNGAVAWGDYNNDGRLDLALQGWSDSGRVTKLYRNDGGGTFTDVSAGFVAVERGALAWGDYNNDGNLDLLVTGGSSSGAIAKVYRNYGDGAFTDIGAAVTGVSYRAAAAWGDYDSDGDLDILLTGLTDGGIRVARVYRNDGGVFTDIAAGLPGTADAGVAWGDFDNDGDLDILYAGYPNATYLCRNDGSNAFSAYPQTFSDVSDAAVGWADYDGDGRLDVLLAGNTGSERVTRLYRNASAAASTNTVPGAPAGLSAAPSNQTATLSWNAAADGETASSNLSYNVRVGRSPGAGDVLSGMANLGTGLRGLPAFGNAGHRRSYTLTGLAPSSARIPKTVR